MAVSSSHGMGPEVRGEVRVKPVRPNFAALAALLALLLLWVPLFSWLHSLLEPMLAFLSDVMANALIICGGLFAFLFFGFVMAVFAMLLGGAWSAVFQWLKSGACSADFCVGYR